ncbi:hypothetical protein CROQUDRAFT_719955 [Cronartium quercuum f. sp. fusiforme G11]|uniref:Uncharacterized protein n=1 Tax=Cronartium quercuum f. sp. fusiforme G11 TaxID=708437 RepID=A0A9P6TGX5_9BASI|nr:hypothetical protein CROQUDRAFT_719955 [Cronartium quercuum f. sp. fusiforme G11]
MSSKFNPASNVPSHPPPFGNRHCFPRISFIRSISTSLHLGIVVDCRKRLKKLSRSWNHLLKIQRVENCISILSAHLTNEQTKTHRLSSLKSPHSRMVI